jgi:hypothetical protein
LNITRELPFLFIRESGKTQQDEPTTKSVDEHLFRETTNPLMRFGAGYGGPKRSKLHHIAG